MALTVERLAQAVHNVFCQSPDRTLPDCGSDEWTRAARELWPLIAADRRRIEGERDEASAASRKNVEFMAEEMAARIVVEARLATLKRGGRISKPNTLPEEVITQSQDREQRDVDEAVKEAAEAALAAVLLIVEGQIFRGAIGGAIRGACNDHKLLLRFLPSITKRVAGQVMATIRDGLGVGKKATFDPYKQHCSTCACGEVAVQRIQRARRAASASGGGEGNDGP